MLAALAWILAASSPAPAPPEVTPLPAYVEQLAADGFVGRIVIADADGDVLYEHPARPVVPEPLGSLGPLSDDAPVPVDVDSMRPVFAAVAIARLVDEGWLSYDDPAARWLVDVPVETTLGELVTERSSRLAEVVTAATGRRLSDYVSTAIFAPAGMEDSVWSEDGSMLVSTLPDLRRFADALRNGRLVSAETFEGWLERCTDGSRPRPFDERGAGDDRWIGTELGEPVEDAIFRIYGSGTVAIVVATSMPPSRDLAGRIDDWIVRRTESFVEGSAPGQCDALPVAGVGEVSNPVVDRESKAQPVFPARAREQRVQGTVLLQAIIDRTGAVRLPRLLRSTSPGFGFEDASLRAVRQWRYEPAVVGGKPVDAWFTIHVDYTIH